MREVKFDRFYIAKEDFEKYQEIEGKKDEKEGTKEDEETSVLKFHPEVFLLAATIGYKYSLREEIDNKHEIVFKRTVMNIEYGELIYNAFKCIALDNDVRDEEGNLKVNTVMEEYANGGFKKLYNEILAEDESNEVNLVNYLMLHFD